VSVPTVDPKSVSNVAINEEEREQRREALEDRVDRVRARLEGRGSVIDRLREQVLVRSAPHGDTDAVESDALAELEELEPVSTNGHEPAPNGRTCTQCGTALIGKQETFCSRNCRKRFAYHRDRADQSPAEIAHDPAPRPERRNDTGTDATASVERRNGTATYRDTRTPPAETWRPLVALLDAGASLTFTIDDVRFTARRAEHR
jgi:hypothetical protein